MKETGHTKLLYKSKDHSAITGGVSKWAGWLPRTDSLLNYTPPCLGTAKVDVDIDINQCGLIVYLYKCIRYS